MKMELQHYMAVTLMIDRVNESFERMRSIGICRMYEDLWKMEWVLRREQWLGRSA